MKCPNCGSGKIQWCDTYDTTTSDEKHIDYCAGFCKDCGVDLLWEEVYCFTGIENMEVTN